MRFWFVLLILLIPISNLEADPRICVRSYIHSNGFDLCSLGSSPRHFYVYPEEGSEKKVCVITYEDRYCKYQKQEFSHAKTLDGRIVCVLNYNQPGVSGNYCATQPEDFSYALDPWR